MQNPLVEKMPLPDSGNALRRARLDMGDIFDFVIVCGGYRAIPLLYVYRNKY